MNNYELLPLVTDNNTSPVEIVINPINNNIPCSEIDNCSICLEPLINNTKKLSCNHILHNDCYDLLYEQNNPKCPLCNVKIVKPETTILFDYYFKIKINYKFEYIKSIIESIGIHCLIVYALFGCVLIICVFSCGGHLYCDNKNIKCDYYYKNGIINGTEIDGLDVLYSYLYDNDKICYNTITYQLPHNKIIEIVNEQINKNIDIFVSKKNNWICTLDYEDYNPDKTCLTIILFFSFAMSIALSLFLIFLEFYLKSLRELNRIN